MQVENCAGVENSVPEILRTLVAVLFIADVPWTILRKVRLVDERILCPVAR